MSFSIRLFSKISEKFSLAFWYPLYIAEIFIYMYHDYFALPSFCKLSTRKSTFSNVTKKLCFDAFSSQLADSKLNFSENMTRTLLHDICFSHHTKLITNNSERNKPQNDLLHYLFTVAHRFYFIKNPARYESSTIQAGFFEYIHITWSITTSNFLPFKVHQYFEINQLLQIKFILIIILSTHFKNYFSLLELSNNINKRQKHPSTNICRNYTFKFKKLTIFAIFL
jgi:hypothetical protein